MSKDLLVDKYGRFYEIPEILNESGHDLVCVCANYYKVNNNYEKQHNWKNFDINYSIFYKPVRYFYFLRKLIIIEKPDLIIGASDIFHVILAYILAKQHAIPCLVDLYDNFESFGAARIPGLKTMFKHVVKNADAVSVVSLELKDFVLKNYMPYGPVQVIENGVDIKIFYPMDKKKLRKQYGIPVDGFCFGFAGAITEKRGVDTLFSAFQKLKQTYKNIHLIIAGPVDKKISLPDISGLHYLGNLDYASVPFFLNLLDVGIIHNMDDEFGNYCFPQKYHEMVACELPVIAANVGTMSRILSDNPSLLFEPGDANSLVKAIEKQIRKPVIENRNICEWRDQAVKFGNLMKVLNE